MHHRLDATASFDLYKQSILQHSSASLPQQSLHPQPLRSHVPLQHHEQSPSFHPPLSKLTDASPSTIPSFPIQPHPSQTRLVRSSTTHTLRPTSFTASDVQSITIFLTSTYYLHYALYLHVFTQLQEVHEEHLFVSVETPVVPPPLSKVLFSSLSLLKQKQKEKQKKKEK